MKQRTFMGKLCNGAMLLLSPFLEGLTIMALLIGFFAQFLIPNWLGQRLRKLLRTPRPDAPGCVKPPDLEYGLRYIVLCGYLTLGGMLAVAGIAAALTLVFGKT